MMKMGMTREERVEKLRCLITCMKCEVSGKMCDADCPTQYNMGNVGEIIENLEEIAKALEQEPTTKNDLGVDCISRQAVLDLIADYDLSMGQVVRGIHALPSVTPQEPKSGHWMNKDHLFESCSAECSSCHKRSNGYVHDNGFSLELKYFDFCPNCGARMIEPQESEVDNGNDD